MSELSTKPYLIRAIYEWCSDNGYRPYIAVVVDERTQVPFEFVRNGEIVLNVSPEATNHLVIGNDLIEFEARFNRVARNVSVPIGNVTAIYAAENGHGMAFEVPKALAVVEPKAPRAPRSLREVGPDEGEAAGAAVDAATDEAPAELAPAPAPRRRGTAKPVTAAPPPDSASPAISLVPAGAGSREADPPVPPESAPPQAPVPADASQVPPAGSAEGGDDPSPGSPPARKGGRPRLTRVK